MGQDGEDKKLIPIFSRKFQEFFHVNVYEVEHFR